MKSGVGGREDKEPIGDWPCRLMPSCKAFNLTRQAKVSSTHSLSNLSAILISSRDPALLSLS
jgi:hypothetical protein